jgi:hypothetical protein
MLKPVADGKYAHLDGRNESCWGMTRNGVCETCHTPMFSDNVIVEDYRGKKTTASTMQIAAGVILPWTDITAGYPLVFDVAAFCKRKRSVQTVILAENYFPRNCSVCNKEIGKADANRADIDPKHPDRIWVAHYDCAWSALLNHVYGPLYDSVMGRQ